MNLRAVNFIVTVMLCIAVEVPLVAGADKRASLKTDVPDHFRAYSYDGASTVQAACRQKAADVITCNLIFIEFLPLKKPGQFGLEAAVKNDPKFAEEMKKNPQKAREQWTKEMEKSRKEFCSDKKALAFFETKSRDPQLGPKRKQNFQQIVDACPAKDPQVLFDSLSSVEKRTCSLWVAAFSLDFKRIGKGQWFSDRGGPQGLCNVVRTYVLKQDEKNDYGLLWTLTETTLAGDTKGPLCSFWPPVSEEELNKPNVWTWNNYKEYELPSCDFIEATYVMPDYPSVP